MTAGRYPKDLKLHRSNEKRYRKEHMFAILFEYGQLYEELQQACPYLFRTRSSLSVLFVCVGDLECLRSSRRCPNHSVVLARIAFESSALCGSVQEAKNGKRKPLMKKTHTKTAVCSDCPVLRPAFESLNKFTLTQHLHDYLHCKHAELTRHFI
jgi:hypothetical protein